jgi:ankyrin repeat protein
MPAIKTQILRILSLFGATAVLAAGAHRAGEASSPSEDLFLYLNGGLGDPAEIAKFIAAGADVNYRDPQYQITPLLNVAHYRQVEAAKLLISRGADVNARNSEGNAALFVAVHQESMELAALFLEKGADVNAKNSFGYTPLRQACRWGNPEAVQLLLSKGADVNATDKEGDTPLHIAVEEHNEAVVKVLVDHHANVNAMGSFGGAPIHRAAAKGMTAIVKLLVDAGADLSVKDRRGHTPMDLVLPFPETYKEIIELLKNAGSKP